MQNVNEHFHRRRLEALRSVDESVVRAFLAEFGYGTGFSSEELRYLVHELRADPECGLSESERNESLVWLHEEAQRHGEILYMPTQAQPQRK